MLPLVAIALATPAGAQNTGAGTTPLPANIHTKGVTVLQPTAPAPEPKVTAPAAPPAPAPIAPVIRECARPFAQPDVSLADGRFDKTLAGKLKGGRTVVVDLPQPYKMGGTPPVALSPWFTEIRAAGGTVTSSQYCQGARGMFGNWLSKLFGGGGGKPYKAVDGYNAVLHVYALDQMVTQIEFVPRDADARQ